MKMFVFWRRSSRTVMNVFESNKLGVVSSKADRRRVKREDKLVVGIDGKRKFEDLLSVSFPLPYSISVS